MQPHHFPMAGHGILAIACLPQPGIVAESVFCRPDMGQPVHICYAQALQVGNFHPRHLP